MKKNFFAALSLAALTACVSANRIRNDADTVAVEVEQARHDGAQRCAPTELATAEADLNFARGELSQGNSVAAAQHVNDAQAAAHQAIQLSRNCGPRNVVVREDGDRDGDGIPDSQDRCPDTRGIPQNQGCPDADRDGDGVPDSQDRCPNVPGPATNQGCPIDQTADRDGDGVPDFRDKCPDLKGTVQNDGCPDADRDGDGIVDRLDKCPDQAGPIKNEGCPVLDKDGDGVPDDVDKCPDKAGPKETDGCPDSDGDGLADNVDKCPNEFGPKDNEGCPKKYARVIVRKDRIEIKQQIKFATGSAKIIGTESGLIIGEVAQALRDNPQIKHIRVEGHTDSIGDDTANLRLSQKRADSVKAALLKLGIDPARMESVGYGESKPIASNSTASGRAENRRTEFNITDPAPSP